ncbi:threonine--tRNA ligase [Patescibacteria group bacterium]|nr:threonine--tRNA ligase [Patescibacteria group bacterium]
MNKKTNIEIVRHSTAHLLAAAVQKLYPKTRFGVGPVIDNGFYYDMEVRDVGGKEVALGEAEMKKIEKQMKKMKAQGLKFVRKEMSIASAIAMFKKIDQKYKVELLEDLKKKGTTSIKDEDIKREIGDSKSKVSVYQLGDFVDLCRGPHVSSVKDIKVYKLHKLAGAYWRGDEKNKMLTRVYGLAFEAEKEMEDYLHMLQEAERRDHRKLGKELGLFTFSDVVGKGLPLWTSRGATIRRELEKFIVDEEIKRGYEHVYTPDIAKLDLYKKSGHYPYYKDSMYAPIKIDEEEFMLRPMTCPHHFELYLSKPRSYKDLPMRIAELAKLYRYEQSGELTGLMRVRSFCLADAHIICADKNQAGDEISKALDLIEYAAKVLGLKMNKDYWYRLALGDRSDTKKYYKDDKAWDNAESILKRVLKSRKVRFEEAEGEAAFYGPKIDIQMKNVRGKEDTAFTVQYDFVMPKRFELKYKDKNGKDKEAVVVHRSSIGAIERTIAFLIERYAGAFPVWLSPVQVQIVPVGKDHKKPSAELAEQFRARGVRVFVDESDETVGYKIRRAEREKVPYMLVVGDKEKSLKKLSVRERSSKDTYEMPVDKFLEKVVEEMEKKK